MKQMFRAHLQHKVGLVIVDAWLRWIPAHDKQEAQTKAVKYFLEHTPGADSVHVALVEPEPEMLQNFFLFE